MHPTNPIELVSTPALLQDVPSAIATTFSKAIGVDLPAATNVMSSIASMTTTALEAAATMAMASYRPDDRPHDHPHDGPPPPPGECRLLGPFALLVQLALGALALLSLVYKRWRERPQRPIKIWAFDVSKQVVGTFLVHLANVFMSMLSSGRLSIALEPGAVQKAQRLLRRDDEGPYIPNPCSFYLLNLGIDTTVGIPILIVLLRIATGLLSYTSFGQPLESIQSGHYGHPPKVKWWLKQCLIYFIGLMGMKLCVLILFLVLPWLARVGDWALSWTEGNEKVQIVFVMMLFPLIMNAMQYYIIDSFIKKKENGHERLPTEEPAESEPLEDSIVLSDESVLDSDDEEVQKSKAKGKTKSKTGGRKNLRRGDELEEYDPDTDGHDIHDQNQQDRGKKTGKVLPDELVPPE